MVPRHVVAYLRVSTEEQATAGVSLAAQESRIRAYCESQGLALAEVFTDPGVSGKGLDRPGLSALLAQVQAGKVGAVVVHKLDRLTRRTRDLLHLSEDVFTRHKVELVSLSEQLDTRTPAGRLMLTLLGALAQMEREQVAERTRTALHYKRAKQERTGGVPLGFREGKAGGPMQPVPGELATVARLVALRESGLSFRRVAERLTAEGHPTKQGGEWAAFTVHRVWTGRARYASHLATT